MRREWALIIAAGATGIVMSCGTGDAPPQADSGVSAGHPDASVLTDAGGDGGARDAGSTVPDAGLADAGPADAGLWDGGVPDAGGVDAGSADAGTPDAGVPDAGTPDAGRVDAGVPDAGRDAGTPDAGTDAGVLDAGPPGTFPNLPDWTFYGPQSGAPRDVFGVTADQGGNVWVAGGEEGLFLLKPGATRFQRFTVQDGLHPYGFLPDGGPAATGNQIYLNAIAVTGGPAGTVFVGYAGKPPGPGQRDCETNWDGENPDPAIYKSGDADKVTLDGAGLKVVHYDIFSGPGVVSNEQAGRERLCHIYRIGYDPSNGSLWFGGNHGFAWGNARFEGNNTCDGQLSCAGTWEHVHPAINAFADEAGRQPVLLTADYRGVAVDPVTHDVWFGGINRSTKFRYGSSGNNYFAAQSLTEDAPNISNRIDVWPDKVVEPNYSRPSERTDDLVMAMAAMPDGTVWVGSAAWGIAHLSASGTPLGYLKSELLEPAVSALATDPSDASLWVGGRWGSGISRVGDGKVLLYGTGYFGPSLGVSPIADIQMDRSGGARRVLVGFQRTPQMPAGIGIYLGR